MFFHLSSSKLGGRLFSVKLTNNSMLLLNHIVDPEKRTKQQTRSGKMKKTTKILSITIAMIIILAAFTSLYYAKIVGNNSQSNKNELTLPAGAIPQWQIEVTGDFSQEKTWTLNQISKMPLTDVIVKSENATYCGVTLLEFCNTTGISWDAGPLNIIGEDGQSAGLNTYQAWNSTYFPYSYSYNVIILVFIKTANG